jgi:Scavenger receptor cysteine-rich domain
MVTEDPQYASLITRLELLYGIGWGAVCRGAGAEELQDAVAAVACKQLDFDDSAHGANITALGPAPASVVHFQLVAKCTGPEKALEMCKGYAIKPVQYTYGSDVFNAFSSNVMLSCMKLHAAS